MLSGGDDIVTDRIRAYTEYRMFTSIARYGTRVRGVYVTLQRRTHHRKGFLVSVVIDLGRTDQIKTQALGPHPTAAIDRVCERAERLLGARDTQGNSP